MQVGFRGLRGQIVLIPVPEVKARVFLERLYSFETNSESDSVFKRLLYNPTLDNNPNVRGPTIEEHQ